LHDDELANGRPVESVVLFSPPTCKEIHGVFVVYNCQRAISGDILKLKYSYCVEYERYWTESYNNFIKPAPQQVYTNI